MRVMKVREAMTSPAIRIQKDETVAVAARTLAHYNIGALPVCGTDGALCGVVTDRDLVTRCMAAGYHPERTRVEQVMSGNVIGVSADEDTGEAARLMGQRQIRRLPVVENGKLQGMISLGDLTKGAAAPEETARALSQISSNITGE